MKWKLYMAAAGLVMSVLWASSSGAALPLSASATVKDLPDMLERVVPGVVNISTRARVKTRQNPLLSDPFFRHFFDLEDTPREKETRSAGSGVIVDAVQGYILTNYHVIEGADAVAVTLNDGRRFPTQLVGVDPEVDIAVLRVVAKGVSAVPLGDSDRLRVGDVVLAIGNPFGLGQTVTSGIVSALGRSNLGIEEYEHFIQTDASINPGNSGGALVNVEGELVGINTAIVGPNGGNIGIGFAIPINMARQIMVQLIEHGEVRRGELGVVAQDLTYDLAQAFGLQPHAGAVIVQVGPGSPAEKAGLRSGDVVVHVNGRPVRSSTQLRNAVGLLRVGASVDLEVVREGKTHSLRAVLAEPEQGEAGRASELLAGAVVGPVQPDHPLLGRLRGLQVLSVERGSAAHAAGLRPGDVIVTVNGVAVTSLSDLGPAVQRSPGRLLMNLRRGKRGLYVVIQ